MSNKPKIRGAKPLLSLTANNEFAALEIHGNNATKACDLLYRMLCDTMTQGTMCVMMAVERLRQCNPDIYAKYQAHIQDAMRKAGERMAGMD